MSLSRFLVPAAVLVTTLAAGPLLGAVALANEPMVTVKAGDTLTGISKRYGVSISSIVGLNRIADPNRIYIGQRLRVAADGAAPSTPVAVPPAAAVPAASPAPGARLHTVARGENLTWIGRRYGVTIAALVAANGIVNPGRIYTGQRLVIPGAIPAPAPAPAPAARAPAAAPATPSAPSAPPTASVAMPTWMATIVAQRDDVRRLITEEAALAGVPATFALAVAWQESGWRQNVVSHAGAVGIMQLMPGTAAWVGQRMLGRQVDINDARDNVRAGVALLAHYLERYAGNRDLVLAAYYQGQFAADRYGVYPVTRAYIASITALERMFGS